MGQRGREGGCGWQGGMTENTVLGEPVCVALLSLGFSCIDYRAKNILKIVLEKSKVYTKLAPIGLAYGQSRTSGTAAI